MTEENQPQPVVEQQGAEAPPVVEPQVGAEETPQPTEAPIVAPERTYSQDEWNKRQSALDTQISTLRKERDEGSMQRQINEIVQEEQRKQSEDQKAVGEGLMTQAEAEQKRQQRQSEAEKNIQSQGKVQQAERIVAAGEQSARIQTAQDFGKKFGLTEDQVGELLRDSSLNSPVAMEAKATSLALERTQGELKKAQKAPQVFDQGQQGSVGDKTEEQSLKTRYPSMYKK